MAGSDSLEGFELGEFLLTSPAWHCVAEQFKKQGSHTLVAFTLDTTVGEATESLAVNSFMAAPVCLHFLLVSFAARQPRRVVFG